MIQQFVYLDPVSGDIILFLGDSITNLNWMAALKTFITNLCTPIFGASSPKMPIYINGGVSGNLVNHLDTAWDTRVGKFAPTIIVILIGINDILVGGPTDPALFQSTYQSVLTKTRTQRPSCQLVLATLNVYGENWPTGTNPGDAAIEDYCARIRNLADINNGVVLEFRNNTYKRDEPAQNPGHAIGGVMYDTTAPGGNALHPTGPTQLLMSNEGMLITKIRIDVPVPASNQSPSFTSLKISDSSGDSLIRRVNGRLLISDDAGVSWRTAA